jgi:hypothetical protein
VSTESITVVGHPPHSTRQYLRSASLIVGDASGNGLDLSALRLVFTVRHSSVQTPRTLEARISNVSKATAGTVQKEFTRVILSCGYNGALAKLFDGQIRQIKFGRESPTDTYLDIIAADGDQAYSTGFINQTLAAGWKAPDIQSQIVAATSGLGLTAGTPPPDTAAGVRPKVMFGPIRDHCRILARSTGTSWSIEDGALNFAPLNQPSGASTQSQNAIVLSPSTGLIGIPKQTLDGVEATCLLNPRIKADRYVKIDSSLIAAATVSTDYQAVKNNPNQVENGSSGYIKGLSPSGTYRVVYVDHIGDTRGNDWFSTIVGFADDGNAKMGQAGVTAVP